MPFELNKTIDKTNLLLDLIGAKQQAIGSNIANVNTPGYARNDVKFEEYLDTINKPLETRLSQKMGPNPLMNEQGGKVTMAEELVSLQKNSLLYSIASRRATMIFQEMKTVTQIGK